MRGTLFDASALAAITLKEEGWEKLLDLLPSKTLDLAFIETYNVIWKHSRILNDLSEEEEVTALKVLEELEALMMLLSAREYLKRAYEVAKTFKVTVYDSLYIAACEKEGARLITRDVKQAEVAEKLGVEVVVV